jgi:hypothetical protein
MKMGINIERKPNEFVKAVEYVNKNYLSYVSNIDRFKVKLYWNRIAKQHLEIYNKSINRTSPIPNPIK